MHFSAEYIFHRVQWDTIQGICHSASSLGYQSDKSLIDNFG